MIIVKYWIFSSMSKTRGELVKSYLLAIDNFLLENAIIVSDTIAISRHCQSRHRVQKASCQSAQTSIAKACICLNFLELFDVHSKLSNGLMSH